MKFMLPATTTDSTFSSFTRTNAMAVIQEILSKMLNSVIFASRFSD